MTPSDMDHVKDQLSEFLDKALDPGRMRKIEEHLRACSQCREEWEDLRSVSAMVAGMPRRHLPLGFLARLDSRRRLERPLSFSLPLKTAAFALSSLFMMFVVYEKIDVIFPVSQRRQNETRPRLDRPDLEQPTALKLAHAKGRPIAASPKPAAPNNEDLQKKIEAEKKQLALQVLPKAEPRRFGMGTLTGNGGAPTAMEAILRTQIPAPEPVAIAGPTPSLLSPGGILLRSPEEQNALWHERGMKLNPPSIDYKKSMIVVIFAENARSAVEISAIKTLPDKVLVQYRQHPLPEGTTQQATLPYQFRAVPRSDLPVSFEKLP